MSQLLCDNKADVNVQDHDGDTPLHWAAIEGYLEICDLLIEHGADVNAVNIKGQTPLDIETSLARNK